LVPCYVNSWYIGDGGHEQQKEFGVELKALTIRMQPLTQIMELGMIWTLGREQDVRNNANAVGYVDVPVTAGDPDDPEG
jgi:hypothetical protein